MIPVRDDAGLKSLSNAERVFLRSGGVDVGDGSPSSSSATSFLRVDGRRLDQVRPHRLQFVRWDNGATVTVTWGSGGGVPSTTGSTKVTCTCTGAVIPPNPDKSSEGIIAIGVDLSPSASTSFRNVMPVWNGTGPAGSGGGGPPPDAQQKLTTNRILRALERIVLTSGTLDTEALCILPEKWVWRISLQITVIDAVSGGGNLLDACVLATTAALSHYRTPHLEYIQSSSDTFGMPKLIPADWREPTPLPLHHMPLSLSFALIKPVSSKTSSAPSTPAIVAMADPNAREELVMAGPLTICLNAHGEVCFVDFGGGCEITPQQLRHCHDLALVNVRQLCQRLEESLKEADEQAAEQRLRRLQQQHQQQSDNRIAVPPLQMDVELDGVPFYTEESDPVRQQQEPAVSEAAQQKAARMAERLAEEAYRQQALDYNIGHIASKLGSGDGGTKDGRAQSQTQQQGGNALLQAMLQSVMSGAAAANATIADVSSMVHTPSNQETPLPPLPPPPSTMPPAKPTVEMMDVDDNQKGPRERLDSDEEETTVQLTTEYASVEAATRATPAPPDDANADADVEDLTAAIKKKKKNKKSKK